MIQAELAEMAEEITHSIQDLRNLIHELNEQILPDGLVSGLERLIQRHQRTYPTCIHTDFRYVPGRLPLNQELNIMRIVQESLANASRHGDASQIWISIQGGDHRITVEIRNNGKAFSPDAQSTGWGLKNMQRRAKQLHADLQITSQPAGETVVAVTIPVAPSESF